MRSNGVSFSLAHEQSTTATPMASTMGLSSGETVRLPTGVSTRPGKLENGEIGKYLQIPNTIIIILIYRWPNFRFLIRLCRANFRPEHFLGSQWFKSHIATVNVGGFPLPSSSSEPLSSDPDDRDSSPDEFMAKSLACSASDDSPVP